MLPHGKYIVSYKANDKIIASKCFDTLEEAKSSLEEYHKNKTIPARKLSPEGVSLPKGICYNKFDRYVVEYRRDNKKKFKSFKSLEEAIAFKEQQ